MVYDPNNIFAKILRSDIPCGRLYEDRFCLAFHDISPKAPVHVLVVPKGEFTSFDDFSANASPELMVGFFQSVGAITRELNLDENGYRLIMNKGANGGQEVNHFHVHILGGKPIGPLVCS